MRVDLFDFDLPEERIALRPVSPRDSAKCLVVQGQELQDSTMRDLPNLLSPGDLLIFNNTEVIRAALQGVRRRNGNEARIQLNLHMRTAPDQWRAFAKPARRLRMGDIIEITDTLSATVSQTGSGGEVTLSFNRTGDALDQAIAGCGEMPLPPYIRSRRKPDEKDAADYQTMFAEKTGSVAAPTAALHFTDELMARLAERDISHRFVTLHVGAGTFLPVKAEDTDAHHMHSEWGEVSAGTADAINATRQSGGCIVAVGTTALRLLETAADADGALHPWAGETDIFITPGYRFRAVDALISNFHLPRSTLFMLVSAFCGLDNMRAAYTHAIANGYRFYSYGDGSLLFRTNP